MSQGIDSSLRCGSSQSSRGLEGDSLCDRGMDAIATNFLKGGFLLLLLLFLVEAALFIRHWIS